MADQWEEAAKQFKPDPGASAPAAAPKGNDDWKIWQQGGTSGVPREPGIIEQGRQFAQEHPYITAAASLLPGVGPAVGQLSGAGPEVAKGVLKQAGRDAYGLMEGAGPLGMAAHYGAEKFGLGDKLRRATEPSNPAQEVGGYATQGAEMALPAPKILNALPSAERAGQGFERVMQIAGHHPVDLTEASRPVIRALELERAGAGAPPAVISKMAERIPQHSDLPMNFRESRDFQSNAGRLSASESLAAKPQMKAQVSALARALADENQAVAERAGVGDQYKAAMTEYRRAMKLGDFKEKATDYAKKAAVTALLGGTGAAAYHHFAQ